MKHAIQSTVLAVALAFAAHSASAGSGDVSCDADFAYNIDIQDDGLSFSENDQQKVRITKSHELYLDGEKFALSDEQLNLLNDYSKQVRELLPLAAGVAEDASAIAIEAVAGVTEALMQDNPQKAAEFKQRIETISTELKSHISNTHLRPNDVVDYVESSDFEAEFEALMETAVEDFLENNIGQMIAAAMSGNDEKVKAFEQRMEKFGQELESKIEARAEQLEVRAKELCQLVENIDYKEAELVKAFDKFDAYQLIRD